MQQLPRMCEPGTHEGTTVTIQRADCHVAHGPRPESSHHWHLVVTHHPGRVHHPASSSCTWSVYGRLPLVVVPESLRHRDVCTVRISEPSQVTCIPSNLVTQTDPRQVRTYRSHVEQERQPYLETRRKTPACPGLELIVHVFILSGKLHAASTKERHVGLMQHWKRSERHAVRLELAYAQYTGQRVADQRRDAELPELLRLLSRSRLLACNTGKPEADTRQEYIVREQNIPSSTDHREEK